jgi:hypothetical protein
MSKSYGASSVRTWELDLSGFRTALTEAAKAEARPKDHLSAPVQPAARRRGLAKATLGRRPLHTRYGLPPDWAGTWTTSTSAQTNQFVSSQVPAVARASWVVNSSVRSPRRAYVRPPSFSGCTVFDEARRPSQDIYRILGQSVAPVRHAEATRSMLRREWHTSRR